jgi:hypothetical protein
MYEMHEAVGMTPFSQHPVTQMLI